jgi:serine/threonine protein kinase
MAPEVELKIGHDKAVDWWALGVLIYEMLTGDTPFQSSNRKRVLDNIVKKQIKLPVWFSPEVRALLKLLLHRAPDKRLGSGPRDGAEIREHPFFRGIDWRAVEAKRLKPPFVPSLENDTDVSRFDQKFTAEAPIDSPSGTPVPPNDLDLENSFRGFSYVASPITPSGFALAGPLHAGAAALPSLASPARGPRPSPRLGALSAAQPASILHAATAATVAGALGSLGASSSSSPSTTTSSSSSSAPLARQTLFFPSTAGASPPPPRGPSHSPMVSPVTAAAPHPTSATYASTGGLELAPAASTNANATANGGAQVAAAVASAAATSSTASTASTVAPASGGESRTALARLQEINSLRTASTPSTSPPPEQQPQQQPQPHARSSLNPHARPFAPTPQ